MPIKEPAQIIRYGKVVLPLQNFDRAKPNKDRKTADKINCGKIGKIKYLLGVFFESDLKPAIKISAPIEHKAISS